MTKVKIEPIGDARKAKTVPKCVYRYLDELEHAQRLLDGYVWLSTLEWCRSKENMRNDPTDGQKSYSSGRYDDSTATPELSAAVTKGLEGAVKFEPGSGVLLHNIGSIEVIPSANLFCSSVSRSAPNMRSQFGQHCICIADPAAFFFAVTNAMVIREGLPVDFAGHDYIDYTGRHRAGLDTSDVNPMLSSYKDLANEKEYRMYWTMNNYGPTERREIYAPEVIALCSRA